MAQTNGGVCYTKAAGSDAVTSFTEILDVSFPLNHRCERLDPVIFKPKAIHDTNAKIKHKWRDNDKIETE
jgi:hypothetical protein